MKIEFSKKELKLLLTILKDCNDSRSWGGCCNAYEDEKKIFTKSERLEIKKQFGEDREDDLTCVDYTSFLISKINSQIKEAKKIEKEEKEFAKANEDSKQNWSNY